MNTRNTEIPSLPINKTQKRLYAASSDPTYEHETFESMTEYLSNPTAYFGQILYCKSKDALYRISKDAEGVKILEGIGAAMDAKNVAYQNDSFPELTNLKLAIDYILEALANSGSGSAVSTEVYYGISTKDGIDNELTKEDIIQNFATKKIESPNADSNIEVEKLYSHIRLDFGINQSPQYFFAAFPIQSGKIKARDLSSGFGDGWFNWNQDETSGYLKTITLPNANGYLQDYVLLRSDNMLIDGSNWMFYFLK